MRTGSAWVRWSWNTSAAAGIAAATVLLAFATATATASAASRPAVATARAAASGPTLGLASSVPNGRGFGKVRPRRVDYGGDPTSFVSHVKWHSWGGRRAVGYGTADWVWPGWCVACGSVELPATVVAFGRTRCDGHSAYSHVEWYFPSRGMSFNRRLSSTNLCTGASPPPSGLGKQLKCGQVSLSSNGAVVAVASGINAFDSPITCTTAQGFVANSGAANYLNQNAMFTVDGWWCGSELSMDFGGPQSFTCVTGDFTNLTFDLKPAGG